MRASIHRRLVEKDLEGGGLMTLSNIFPQQNSLPSSRFLPSGEDEKSANLHSMEAEISVHQ